MDLSSINLFGIMKSKMGYLSERQTLLAQNIANADTPDYKAVDLPQQDFHSMLGSAQKLQMMVTNPGHVAPATGGGAFKPEQRKTTYELNPNGNNVVVEEEMSKVAQNQAEYQKVLNLYAKMVGMFKLASGNPNGGA